MGVLLIGFTCVTLVAMIWWDQRRLTRVGTCSAVLMRNPLAAYVIVLLAVVAAFVQDAYRTEELTDRIDEKAVAACEAVNNNSDVQRAELLASRRRLEALDPTQLFGTPPDQVPEFRRLARESSDQRLASLRFLDCETGKPVPAPPPPP